jgi:HEAT repeat protein
LNSLTQSSTFHLHSLNYGTLRKTRLKMSVTPESVKELLRSDDFGQRLSAVNQLRQLDPAIAFELIQPAIADQSVRVRYAAVSQMARTRCASRSG